MCLEDVLRDVGLSASWWTMLGVYGVPLMRWKCYATSVNAYFYYKWKTNFKWNTMQQLLGSDIGTLWTHVAEQRAG